MRLTINYKIISLNFSSPDFVGDIDSINALKKFKGPTNQTQINLNNGSILTPNDKTQALIQTKK